MDKLSDEQLSAFDKEYVNDRRWVPVARCLADAFPDGRFSFLDLGGGNGRFADRVLAAFPHAHGTVLDSSSRLLALNAPSPRKRTLVGDASELAAHPHRYDVVFCNWLLHHLVTTGSYAETRRNVLDTLVTCRDRLLTARGFVSVYENDYEGLVDDFPGRAIFAVTSLRRAAPLMRRLGANTAGVGVCFRSSRAWRRLFAAAGYELVAHTQDADSVRVPWYARAAFLIRRVPRGHYWLMPARQP